MSSEISKFCLAWSATKCHETEWSDQFPHEKNLRTKSHCQIATISQDGSCAITATLTDTHVTTSCPFDTLPKIDISGSCEILTLWLTSNILKFWKKIKCVIDDIEPFKESKKRTSWTISRQTGHFAWNLFALRRVTACLKQQLRSDCDTFLDGQWTG